MKEIEGKRWTSRTHCHADIGRSQGREFHIRGEEGSKPVNSTSIRFAATYGEEKEREKKRMVGVMPLEDESGSIEGR